MDIYDLERLKDQKKDLRSLENELRLCAQKLPRRKTLEVVTKYVQSKGSRLRDNNRKFFNLSEISSSKKNELLHSEQHLFLPFLTIVLEYVLLYSNIDQKKNKKFLHNFCEAIGLSWSIYRKLSENNNLIKEVERNKEFLQMSNRQILSRISELQMYFINQSYFHVLARIIYFYTEVPKILPIDLEDLFKKSSIDIQSILWILMHPQLTPDEELASYQPFSLDDLLNPDDLKLPAQKESITKTFEELCWNKENYEKFRKSFSFRSSFSQYPLVPVDKDKFTVIFKNVFINTLWTNIYFKLKDQDNRNEFQNWFSHKAIEKYIATLLIDCLQSLNIELHVDEKQIRTLCGISKDERGEQTADFILIRNNLCIVIESKAGIRDRNPCTLS